MKYILVSYYFPPDLGAGSFRSVALVKNLLKNIKKNDTLHVISASPNRYDSNLNFSKKFKIDDLRVTEYKVKVFNHKERIILKSLSGIVYFIKTLLLILKIKPDVCICSTARLITGLSGYLGKTFLNYRYFLDVRDIFSESVNAIYPNLPLKKNILYIIRLLEKKVFESAYSINFVSKGFQKYCYDYNLKIKKPTFFSNGVDKIFLKKTLKKNKKITKLNKILYVGNIGDGQSLHKIIPKILSNKNNLKFTIIGDGSKKNLLKDKLKGKSFKKIKMLKPRSQIKLIDFYKKTDLLFLHLNNNKVFERVIPSKIFEYLTFNKPVICGVSGYTKLFVSKFYNTYFFDPCNEKSFLNLLKTIQNKLPFYSKNNFNKLKKFERDELMNNYSKFIVKESKKLIFKNN